MKSLKIKTINLTDTVMDKDYLMYAIRRSEELPNEIVVRPCKLIFVDSETNEETDVEFI